MKRIYIFIIIGVFCIAGLTFWLGSEYMNYRQAAKEYEEASRQELTTEVQIEYLYYLAIHDDMVIVYQNDKETIYEYTDILLSDLPTEVQEELKNGKFVLDDAELYDFLESYSS